MLDLRFLVLSALAFSGINNAQVDLGIASAFAVLAGTAVTNTGSSTTNGSVGVAPGTAITGFPPGTITNGAMHLADTDAFQAQAYVAAAYAAAAGLPPNTDLSGQDLGGMTLGAGVYSFSSSAQLTGSLVLDGHGDPSSVWVFQIGSTLTTASAASVLLINGGSPCNVFWQVGSSASVGAATAFVGSVLALASIDAVTGSSFNGGLYARNGAVTLDTNNVLGGLACPTTATCLYKQYTCGYNLVAARGYNNAELTAAANQTGPIPPLTTDELLQVLYYCNDTANHIVGNSFCIAGCIAMPFRYDDQCAM
ncbi:hypothetical protein TOPH_03160 [Tolypocladium ophioglossoides CBS 100239]|uniref:Ice-binding protein n=1 Tax=Tolypocladium ophioglossoides (strain CBS 100239) TaxID=1163406 RepID=A0A0L0NE43_TOLOC|nr:hypothetical protein TOPH_03160 [Tolypocladium ophioglossoides CBS 100239]